MQAGSEEAKLSWLRQILEWQRDTDDSKEFLSMVKGDLDLFSDSVYCFTPSGDVKTLPSGSTPLILHTVYIVQWGIRWWEPG